MTNRNLYVPTLNVINKIKSGKQIPELDLFKFQIKLFELDREQNCDCCNTPKYF